MTNSRPERSSDLALYSITVMPDGEVRLYPGPAMTLEDMDEATEAVAAVAYVTEA